MLTAIMITGLMLTAISIGLANLKYGEDELAPDWMWKLLVLFACFAFGMFWVV